MALSHPLIASQAEAAETRSRQALRSPIDLMEPTRLGMLAPLSARLGQSRTQSRTQSRAPSRSTSRPLLRGAAAHHLTHSRSSPVYTMEMAARWEATITGQGRPPTSPISPTSPYRRLGGSPLGRRGDDASSPTQQRISFSPTMTTSPPEPNSPSRGTSRRQPRANGSNHFDATGLQSHHVSLPEIARPYPRKDSSGNHVVADVWPMWGGGAMGSLERPAPRHPGASPTGQRVTASFV